MRRAILWVPMLALATACTASFKPASFVDKPRILGIVAEPPEVVPKDGTVSFRAVVGYPLPGKDHPDPWPAVKSLVWDGCLVSLGPQAAYQCVAPLFWSDAGETASFQGSGIEEQLDAFKENLPTFLQYYRQIVEDSDKCGRKVLANWDECIKQHGEVPQVCIDPAFVGMKSCFFSAGLDVMFHLTVTLQDGTIVEGYKRVRFRDPGDGTIAPNHNPGFSLKVNGTIVGCAGVPDGERAELGCPAVPPRIEACPGEEVEFLERETRGSLEKIHNADGTTEDEGLFYSFFSDAGEFKYVHAVPATPQNTLTMPGVKDMPDVTTVWVFFRDDRGGASWQTFPVAKRIDPPCGILKNPVDVILPDAAGDAWFTGDAATTVPPDEGPGEVAPDAIEPGPDAVGPGPDAVEPDATPEAGGAE